MTTTPQPPRPFLRLETVNIDCAEAVASNQGRLLVAWAPSKGRG